MALVWNLQEYLIWAGPLETQSYWLSLVRFCSHSHTVHAYSPLTQS